MLFQLRKPDVAAPGVSILAAYPPLDKDDRAGYAMLSGTSMACPHVSGIVALIKSEHPNWSPAAIRSTLVTTGESLLIQLVFLRSTTDSNGLVTFHTISSITEGNRWNGHN